MASIIQAQGGGWFELPGGKKVRGRRAAELAVQGTSGTPSLTGRLNFIRQAGLQYAGIRDVYKTAGYILEGKETFDNYWSLYERDPVAGRVVDMPAKTTWRTPPEVFEGEQEKEKATDFEDAWLAMAKRLRVWRHFERVDRLARIGRYAILLIGTKVEDDRAMEQPMEKLAGPEDVLYLSSFVEKYAMIEKWETDPSSPRFGLPTLYKVDLSAGVKAFNAKSIMVHHSRVVHVAEDPLTDEVFGRPVLKRILNALADLLKVTASTGEAYWQLAARILTAEIDPKDTEISDTAMDEMGEALEGIVHDLRRQFVGQGVKLDWLKAETPKPADVLEVYKSLMGVGSGIPTRILFGSEQGQLASSQDERAYFGMINERQEQHAEPNILRAFIDRLIGVAALPRPTTSETMEDYEVVWPALFELTEKEVAEANLVRAKAAAALTPMGGSPLDLVEVDKDRNVWLVPHEQGEQSGEALGGIEEDELDELEE